MRSVYMFIEVVTFVALLIMFFTYIGKYYRHKAVGTMFAIIGIAAAGVGLLVWNRELNDYSVWILVIAIIIDSINGKRKQDSRLGS